MSKVVRRRENKPLMSIKREGVHFLCIAFVWNFFYDKYLVAVEMRIETRLSSCKVTIILVRF